MKTFRNNAKIKAAGVSMKWTNDMIKEYIRCKDDIFYFIEKYFMIITENGLEHMVLRDYQRDMIDAMNGSRFTMAVMSRQAGKALDLNTPIFTPNGFKLFKDIHKDDIIYSIDGKKTKVIFETETMYNHECYNVEFAHGETITADAEHVWTVEIIGRNVVTKDMTTKELKKLVERRHSIGQSVRIKISNPIEFDEQPLPIDPYLFGLWLGDGTKSRGYITCHEDDLEDYKQYIDVEWVYSDTRNNKVKQIKIRDLHNKLKENNLLYNKHIPEIYMFNSIDNRIALLQGMMDTDGSVTANGGLEFYQKDKALIDQFRFVLSSLSIKSTVREKVINGETYYTVAFCNRKYDLFKLKRKLLTQKERFVSNAAKNDYFYIKEIVPTESVPVKCIQVENESHLFLCGKTLIPTHNTECFRAFITHYILFNEYKTVAVVANKEAASIEILNKLQISYQNLPAFLQQGIIEFNKGTFVLENGSRVFASATSKDALRGYTVHVLIVDEAAHVDNWAEFYGAIQPTISAGKETKLIMASCVTDDTMIITENGIMKVKDYVNYSNNPDPNHGYLVEPYRILGKNGINNGRVMVNSGYVPTKKIKLQHSEIECSFPHKLYTYKDGAYDWVKSEELNIGDRVAVQYGQNIWGNDDGLADINIDYYKALNKFIPPAYMTEDLAYFLGLYLAEGYTDKIQKRTIVTCGDDIRYAIDPLNIRYKKLDDCHYNISCASLTQFIEKFGFNINLKAKEKVIPERLFRMSPRFISKFLSGFVDGDGHISKSKEFISITSASEKLIDQIRMLLLNFGILSIKRFKISPPTKKVSKYCDCYVLEISAKHYYKFNELIGFTLPRKKALMKEITLKRNGSSQDIIPNAVELLKENDIKYSLCGQHKDQINLSRDFCLSLDNIDKVKDIISSDIIWSKVVSIEDSNNTVYDFSLDDIKNDKWCHSVIYNGIVGHQTPNGLNHFYELYEGSSLRKNTNGFTSLSVPWYRVPGRDEKWKEETLKQLNFDYVKFDQEYEISFIGSSNTLIMGWKLEQLKAGIREPLHIVDQTLFIYEYPIKSPQHRYVIIADVSRGKGLDYSAFSVMDVTSIPYKQVCSYKNNEITPVDYAGVIFKMAEYYNGATVLTEINDIGEQVGDVLLNDLEYEHVLCSEGTGRGGKKLCYFHEKADRGIRTTVPLKLSGCLLLKLLLEQNKLEIYDEATINELLVFVKSKTSYAAEKGYHDDLAMTNVIFAWLTDQDYFKENYELNTQASMAEKNVQDLEDYLTPIGYYAPKPNALIESYASINNLNLPFSPFRQFEVWEEGYRENQQQVLENCDEAYRLLF
jgi:intein/homing endonuclease